MGKSKLRIVGVLAAAIFFGAAWYVFVYRSYPPFMPPGVDFLTRFFWSRDTVLENWTRYIASGVFAFIGLLVSVICFRMSKYLP